MADSLVTTAFDAGTGVARLTFNRPKALNAINVPLAEAFLAAVREIRDLSGVRCIVLTGAGRAFMAGGDVSSMAGTSEQAGAAISAILDAVNPAILLLRSMDAPVIAAVRGVAAGAGLSLTLMADLVIADEEAKFLVAYNGIGAVPDCGGVPGPMAKNTHRATTPSAARPAYLRPLTSASLSGAFLSALSSALDATESRRQPEPAVRDANRFTLTMVRLEF